MCGPNRSFQGAASVRAHPVSLDMVMMDTNKDGKYNRIEMDATGDGKMDTIKVQMLDFS